MYTSISLPNSDEISQDQDGFVTHNKTFVKNIPARKMDTTRNDELMAHQMGYSVSAIFEISTARVTTSKAILSMKQTTSHMTSSARTRKKNRRKSS